ncbi:MAG: NUMOD3 domain-containing DNA-binding protein [Nanoarchaeota archaeon]
MSGWCKGLTKETDERIKRRSGKLKGKPKSEIHKKHLLEAQIKYFSNPENRAKLQGKNNPMYGKHHSKEAKKIKSEKNKAWWTPEMKEQQRLVMIERCKNMNPEDRKKKFGQPKELNPMYGKHHSIKSKESMSKNQMGHSSWSKGLTKETNSSLLSTSIKHTGRIFSEIHRKAMSNSRIGKIRIKREIRQCACGCGKIKEVKINSNWKYIIGHNPRQKFNINRYGKSPGHGKGCWFEIPEQGKVFLRSSWEVIFVKYLIAKRVKFRYEYKRFILDGKTFLPDFYLVDENKFIEIKGWVKEKDIQKMEEMKRFYPDVKIEMITDISKFKEKINE